MKQCWVLHVTCTITTEVKSYTPWVTVSLKQLQQWMRELEFPWRGTGVGAICKMDISEITAKPECVLKPWRCSRGFTTKFLYKIHNLYDLHLLLPISTIPAFKSHWKPLAAIELEWFGLALLNKPRKKLKKEKKKKTSTILRFVLF